PPSPLRRRPRAIPPPHDPINLEQLKHFLPQRWEELGGDAIQRIGHRASARCQSPDFLPQAGALPDPRQLPHDFLSGVFLNIGHGSRGLTHTPLCADLIAEQLSGLPASVEPALIQALAPERFVHRQRKRQPNWPSG
ncbi:MAG: FAD-dependent oxidoreductase, partial [Pseudomonadota bacterium]